RPAQPARSHRVRLRAGRQAADPAGDGPAVVEVDLDLQPQVRQGHALRLRAVPRPERQCRQQQQQGEVHPHLSSRRRNITAAAPARAIKAVTEVTVAFTGGDIKQSWKDFTNPATLPTGVTHSSYLCVVPSGSTTCATDPNTTTLPASNVMQINIPTTLADGA